MQSESDSVLVSNQDLVNLFDRHNIPAVDRQYRCELVSPGCFKLITGSGGFLASNIGSGIGVALYDRTAGVGGIIHILLSKPSGRSATRQPAHYADSGLQFILDALIKAGAQKERLKASVAGGVLMRRSRDSLGAEDIGQLASDRVLQQLSELQIPLEQVAVGGLTPCSLLLDSKRWQATINLFSNQHTASSLALPAKPSAEMIDKAIFNLKPIPQVALKVMQLLGQESETKFEDLANEIKKDQVISARVLLHCNSPVYGFSQTISSIDRALVLLGEKNLFEVVIAAAVNVLYSEQDKGYALMQGGLYRHALATAYVAKEITFFTGCVDPGVAYTAGLIHDIGKIVLDRFVAELLPFFYQHLQKQEADMSELENRLFETNHTLVGAQLARQWDFPENLAAAIEYHHSPVDTPATGRMLVHITYLADLLASHYLAGTELERINSAQLDSSLAAIGLRYSQLPYIIDSIPWNKLMAM